MIFMMSIKPNKQRSASFNATLMDRRESVAAHLSKELRAQYKRRSMALKKGDEVKIIRGEFAGKAGAVTAIDTKGYKILVNGITLKRTIGTEKQVPIEPSNVVITSMNLDDVLRQKILLRKVKEVKVEKKQAPAAEAKPAEKTEADATDKKPEAEKPKTVKQAPAKTKKVKE